MFLYIIVYASQNCPASVYNHDSLGRTALHIAASTCGKHDVVSWLVKTFACDLNAIDRESGWTALHRAVYNGRIASAVLLLKVIKILLIFCGDHSFRNKF